MKYSAKYEYEEQYIPPRCRKPRYRSVEKTIDVTIREVDDELAPVAMIVHDYATRKTGKDRYDYIQVKINYRLYKNKLYTPCISMSGDDIGEQYCVSDIAYRINETGYSYNATEKERIKKVRPNAQRYIIVDGILHEQTGEPMYNITTFGLGHNHGGWWYRILY